MRDTATLAGRLLMWGRDDLGLLGRPPQDVDVVKFLRVFGRYGLPRSAAAWAVEAFDLPAGRAPGLARSGLPQLVTLFVFHRHEWAARPDWVRLFADMLALTRDELRALLDAAFPPDAAAWCPLCSGPVHRTVDVAGGRSSYGEEGDCRWCRARVRPVGWSRVRHLLGGAPDDRR